jgi:tight adherence protein B
VLLLALSLIFLTVTLGIFAGCYFFGGIFFRDAALMRQRVDNEFRKVRREPGPASPLFKNVDRLNLGERALMPEGAAVEASLPRTDGSVPARLGVMLEQADLGITPRQLMAAAAVLGLVLGVAATWWKGPLLGTVAAAAGAAVPLIYVEGRRRARREKLLSQLPNAFDLMARVIRAGQSVTQALQAIADTAEAPIAAEFANCQKRQNLGLRPEVAFHEMAQRCDLLELRIFVMALLIQRQTGGNLSDVLERLATLIRERLRLRKRVRNLTAEGRLQGITLLVLPVLVFGAMMVINRPYAEALLDHPHLLTVTGISMAVGAFWMRSVINIEP